MKTIKIVAFIIVCALVMVGVWFLLGSGNFDVLNPQGEIARRQRNLLLFTVGLSLIVIIPVFAMLGIFAWKFRESNPKKQVYKPDWDSNNALEVIWWGVPIAIISVLAVVTWVSSHQLDPYKKLESEVKPLEVQVVALQWKWLFIYPEQDIASVNQLNIPEKTPINFTITSDAPMNSFWIPSLGGQVYAMSGMSTKLHLIADGVGEYSGSSANISGTGFADMQFKVYSQSRQDFDSWVKSIHESSEGLDQKRYDELAEPSSLKQPKFFRLEAENLYDTIVMKYMMPDMKHDQTDHKAGEDTKMHADHETRNHHMYGQMEMTR